MSDTAGDTLRANTGASNRNSDREGSQDVDPADSDDERSLRPATLTRLEQYERLREKHTALLDTLVDIQLQNAEEKETKTQRKERLEKITTLQQYSESVLRTMQLLENEDEGIKRKRADTLSQTMRRTRVYGGDESPTLTLAPEPSRNSRDLFVDFAKRNKEPVKLKRGKNGDLSEEDWRKWCERYEDQFRISGMDSDPTDNRLLIWFCAAFDDLPVYQKAVREAIVEHEVVTCWTQFKERVQDLAQPEHIRIPKLYTEYQEMRQKPSQSAQEFYNLLSDLESQLPKAFRKRPDEQIIDFRFRLNKNSKQALDGYRPEWMNYETRIELVNNLTQLENSQNITLTNPDRDKNPSGSNSEVTRSERGGSQSRGRSWKSRGGREQSRGGGRSDSQGNDAHSRSTASESRTAESSSWRRPERVEDHVAKESSASRGRWNNYSRRSDGGESRAGLLKDQGKA
jgi:hypothetical protein